MHIFLTNDDGYEAPGIVAMAKKLVALGRVTGIAPDKGRSSCSSSLSLQTYLRLWYKESYGENITVLACSGTTADCAKLALCHWLKSDMPDLIVSGINNGYNTGSDCIYSGTVGGALEGIFAGIPSIALSAETTKEEAFLEKASDFALDVVKRYFIEKNYRGILNLNMPKPAKHLSFAQLKVKRLGLQHYDNAIQEMRDPSGHLGFWLSGKGVTAALLLDLLFYIIITPVISLTLSKLMLMSENTMLVTDALKRMDAVLTAPALSRPEQPQSPKDSAVTFDHVTFSYDGTKNALEDISLPIGAGETAALVGPSGGGKSTLASLAARFFDPTSGAVSIGGVNVKDMDPGQLMNTVSFVLQNSHLIKASILDNVRLGRPDASETQVMAALEQAQCMDIIEKFPQGVHTVIGSQGVYLSGGEMQRIAIARAILKDAPVLILDEATAFADPDNERKVQAALTRLAQGRTVLMIAHRLSTVTGADKIFVLEEGRLVQQGSFVQLSQSPGLFGRMWNEYQQSVAWNVAKEA